MSTSSIIRRRAFAKELRLAEGYVKTREEYEDTGATFLGSARMAAEQSYFTPAACARMKKPVTDQEWEEITHFAMIKDCYQDQCITDSTGRKYRPCLPVFFREKEAMQ